MATKNDSPEIELRYLHSETRAAYDSNGKPIIQGIAPVYNSRSDVIIERGARFLEVVLPGALNKVLSWADVRGRYNHRVVLGRTKARTLELRDTPQGLQYTIHVNSNDPEAMSIYERVARGDVDGSSFAFQVPPGGDEIKDEGGIKVRYIKEISNLMDVGPVDFPAYPASTTSAAVRSQLGVYSTGSDPIKARAAARRRALELLELTQPEDKKGKARRKARARTLQLQKLKSDADKRDHAHRAATKRKKDLAELALKG